MAPLRPVAGSRKLARCIEDNKVLACRWTFDEVGMPRLLSVNVGLPRDVTWNGKTVRTAIWKSPVNGRRMARKLDIDGDAQTDLAGHGGEQRAVFVYQMDSYHDVLVTREETGRVARAVADRIDLGRRLARAVPA